VLYDCGIVPITTTVPTLSPTAVPLSYPSKYLVPVIYSIMLVLVLQEASSLRA
jgi:hypothetical protein